MAVTAAPITPLDVLCATGTSYFGARATPYVPGVQGVGVVRESPTVPAGTRVWVPTTAGMQPGDGSLAELCAVPETELVRLRDGASDAHVAALGLSAVAAWMALTWRAELRPGDQVLDLGAGGVVGQVAVQAARLLGARRVVVLPCSTGATNRFDDCRNSEDRSAHFSRIGLPALRMRTLRLSRTAAHPSSVGHPAAGPPPRLPRCGRTGFCGFLPVRGGTATGGCRRR